jgi:nuclease-like protein
MHTGLFWIALGLGAASVTYALDADVASRSLGLDRTLFLVLFAIVPLPALALGFHGLARTLRQRAASVLADRTAAYLSENLPSEYVVVAHYGPRDGGEEIGVVVIGPPGVAILEPSDESGEILCFQDQWYRRKKYGVGRRIGGTSLSQRARWNATRVRSDISAGGFIRTPVDALVVFTRAQLGDVSSSCVPAIAGMESAVGHLVRGARADASRDRTRALADALAGPVRLVPV